MVLAELEYRGKGGLGGLVGQLAAACENVFARHGRDWSPAQPITLREALALSLQQQMLGGYPSPVDPGHDACFHVWIALPEGGLDAWCEELAWRLVHGSTRPEGAGRLNLDLRVALGARLAPCLHRTDALPQIFAGRS
jgi:hypothetical protein